MTKHTRTPPRPEAAARTNWFAVAAAVALTLGLRLWFIFEMRGTPFSTVSPQMVDSFYYHRWALEILHKSFWGNDVFFLRPLYPYLLAGVYAVFGPHALPVQLLQALMSGISCLLLYDYTQRLFNARAGMCAAFGFALTGVLVFYSGALLYVELTVFLSLLFLWLILVAGQHWWRWLVAGVVFGLLVICRPELLIVLPFLLLWLRSRPFSNLQSRICNLQSLLALTAAALLVIASVPVRNYLVAHDPVLFTAHSGLNFYYGNNPAADGTWQPTSELERTPGFSHERLKQVSRTIDGKVVPWSQASAYWTRKGLSFIAHDPLRYARLLGRKLLLFWSNYEVPNNYYPETARASSLALRLSFLNFGLIAALGFIGMALAWPLRRRVLPVYLFVAAYLTSALAFYALSRLRAPVLPFLLMFAGFAVSEALRVLKARRLTPVVLGAAIAATIYAGSALIPVRRATYTTQAWTQYGNILLDRREVQPAVADFQRAVAADPSSPSARYGLVMAYSAMGRAGDAEAQLRELEQTQAVPALLRMAAARVAITRRYYTTASVLYHAQLAADSADGEAAYMLGLVYVSTDSLYQAQAMLRRAVELAPDNDAARSALEAVKQQLGRPR